MRTPLRPWLVAVRPSASSSRSAMRTVSRLTPSWLISSPSEGSRSPGASSPERIRRRRVAATTSGAREGLVIVPALSILSRHGDCPEYRRAERGLSTDAVRGDRRGLRDNLRRDPQRAVRRLLSGRADVQAAHPAGRERAAGGGWHAAWAAPLERPRRISR